MILGHKLTKPHYRFLGSQLNRQKDQWKPAAAPCSSSPYGGHIVEHYWFLHPLTVPSHFLCQSICLQQFCNFQSLTMLYYIYNKTETFLDHLNTYLIQYQNKRNILQHYTKIGNLKLNLTKKRETKPFSESWKSLNSVTAKKKLRTCQCCTCFLDSQCMPHQARLHDIGSPVNKTGESIVHFNKKTRRILFEISEIGIFCMTHIAFCLPFLYSFNSLQWCTCESDSSNCNENKPAQLSAITYTMPPPPPKKKTVT